MSIKKTTSLLLVLITVFSLTACNSTTVMETSNDPVEIETDSASDYDTNSKTTESEITSTNEKLDESDTITEDEAQEIAIADSGLSESKIKYINTWTEKEDGQWLYVVEFGTYDDTEYKYKIDMYTGEIAASYIESH